VEHEVDRHDAMRNQMLKSCVNRREQMLSDGVQLAFDMEQWNSLNSAEEPIALRTDLALDIEIRKAADDEGESEVA
ncbi:MAG: hypothetical protein PSV22_11810, partial [Pseudolabrys sp.]|nr:hypothetical protein [Pseudolabrys sp.]